MNAERLHVVARSIHKEMVTSQVLSLLKALNSNLKQQINQPQQPQHQQEVANHLSSLYAALENAGSNDYSPAWVLTAEEIGAYNLLGSQLQARLQNIFERNQITPSVALEEVTTLYTEVGALMTSLEQLMSSFEHLYIGYEVLDPGECELGILIPRGFVNNDLDIFAKELEELDSIFKTLAEVATGSRPNLNIRTISSSDLTVFLDLAPEIAACTAFAVERIITLYKQLLEIRKLHKEMRNTGVPEDSLVGVEDHANNLMNDGIDKLAIHLLDKYFANGDKGRRNELHTGLRFSLKKIANRIDNGFNIEIRVEPYPAPDEDSDGEAESAEAETHINVIQSASKNLQFIKLEGDPLLCLPESEQDQKD